MASNMVNPMEERKGYENYIFGQQISEEFKCPICLGVLKEAQHLVTCQHLFCKLCITDYFGSSSQPNHCPVDRSLASVADVKPAPRTVLNLIQKLEVNCNNYMNGCTARMVLCQLDSHEANCQFTRPNIITVASGATNQIEVEASMSIQLKLPDSSKTLIINIGETDNVLSLKRRIKELEGLDINLMVLIHGTKTLEDDTRLLSDYNIKNGSLIFSSFRCSGG